MSNNLNFLKFIIISILINIISTRTFLEHSKIKIDNKIFSKTDVYIEAQRLKENIFSMSEDFLPSDLVTFYPKKQNFQFKYYKGL